MKILHIDPDDMDNPVSGGGPIRTYEICRRLVARGHEVTVLTPTFPGSTAEKVREGVRYLRVGRRLGDHGSSHHITFFFQAPRQIAQHPHDLLVEDFMPPMGPTLTPWFAKKPLVASIQWFMAESWQKKYKLPFVFGQRRLIQRDKNFIVLSQQMSEHVSRSVRGARVETIANAVPDHYFALDAEYGDFILYVGRVDARDKGVDLLLQAYAKIPGEKRIPLLIVGHGWEFDDFKTMAESLKIAASVQFLGKKSSDEVAELYRSCRFTCVPSRVETFGLVILEAQAAAKSVVVFDLSPMNEVANPVGCAIVPAFEVDSYAQAMLHFLSLSKPALASCGGMNRRYARQYSWDASALAQERFYQAVVDNERAR